MPRNQLKLHTNTKNLIRLTCLTPSYDRFKINRKNWPAFLKVHNSLKLAYSILLDYIVNVFTIHKCFVFIYCKMTSYSLSTKYISAFHWNWKKWNIKKFKFKWLSYSNFMFELIYVELIKGVDFNFFRKTNYFRFIIIWLLHFLFAYIQSVVKFM